MKKVIKMLLTFDFMPCQYLHFHLLWYVVDIMLTTYYSHDLVAYFFDVILGCLYNQVLAGVRSTDAGIKYLYCTFLVHMDNYDKNDSKFKRKLTTSQSSSCLHVRKIVVKTSLHYIFLFKFESIMESRSCRKTLFVINDK